MRTYRAFEGQVAPLPPRPGDPGAPPGPQLGGSWQVRSPSMDDVCSLETHQHAVHQPRRYARALGHLCDRPCALTLERRCLRDVPEHRGELADPRRPVRHPGARVRLGRLAGPAGSNQTYWSRSGAGSPTRRTPGRCPATRAADGDAAPLLPAAPGCRTNADRSQHLRRAQLRERLDLRDRLPDGQSELLRCMLRHARSH
jgi:hypothetical protein